jgi:serine/threonine protein kinase
MYCPKCKQSFEEGSRRFCPSDGARLVSNAPLAGRREGIGIFSKFMSQAEVGGGREKSISETPMITSEPSRSEPASINDDISGDFFVIEDVQPEPEPMLEQLPEIEPVLEIPTSAPQAKTAKPAARKIKPFEIPAGHAEVAKGDRVTLNAADFPANDPESYVGRIVKGRYQVVEFLGGEEGSFAFLGEDRLADGRMVLVRILPPEEYGASGGILDEEIVALSHISHPNIARLIDSGQFNDGTRFLVTEYVDALSVYEILSIHGKLDPLRTARIIRQIANALSEVHQEGVVHRDIRPENIIVTPGEGEAEQAVLVNFGASNGEANDVNRAFKAPEVFDGRGSTIASDIYSLAVVAYEMLTGILPFDAPTSRAMVRAQYAGLERLPTEVNPELPSTVDRVLEKALAFSLADRYVKARDFGEAFYAALAESTTRGPAKRAESKTSLAKEAAATAASDTSAASDEPSWKNRSPEPPQTGTGGSKIIAGVGIALAIALLAVGWYYVNKQSENASQTDQGGAANIQPAAASNTEMPPQPRNIAQPPNTNFYQNSKQDLKGDLLRNFVGFSLYYPKDWKVIGPQASATSASRGKFLDISRLTPDGRMKEQMLVSYYPSKGTFAQDADKFPQMVKETNDTLKKLLPGYQMVSDGEIKVNGDWRAYEIKFQSSGASENGEKLTLWGRRLFIPAARAGVHDGFEITMLATSLADDVKSVDDVGVRGELASILYSFEPSQNF